MMNAEKETSDKQNKDINGLIKKGYITVIAGPCAIESLKQVDETAKVISALGISYMRGGAYKPRTSPYSFQGLEEKGLEILRKIGDKYNLKTVTEVTDTVNAEIVADYADVLQIGTRNMSNFALLKKVGEIAFKKKKAVILKRGWASRIKEWLLASEYLGLNGDVEVILCERGIRTFDTNTRFTLDLAAVPVIKKLSKLPIIIDPSHAMGQSDLVIPMSRAAVAAGADGLIVETHYDPASALVDGQQSLNPGEIEELLKQVKRVASVIGKKVR